MRLPVVKIQSLNSAHRVRSPESRRPFHTEYVQSICAPPECAAYDRTAHEYSSLTTLTAHSRSVLSSRPRPSQPLSLTESHSTHLVNCRSLKCQLQCLQVSRDLLVAWRILIHKNNRY